MPRNCALQRLCAGAQAGRQAHDADTRAHVSPFSGVRLQDNKQRQSPFTPSPVTTALGREDGSGPGRPLRSWAPRSAAAALCSTGGSRTLWKKMETESEEELRGGGSCGRH